MFAYNISKFELSNWYWYNSFDINIIVLFASFNKIMKKTSLLSDWWKIVYKLYSLFVV